MKKLILLLALFTAASCSSPEERAQRAAQKEIRECTQSGYKPDTPAFDDCRLQVRALEEQKKADRIAAADSLGDHSRSTPPGMSIPLP